MEMTRRTAMLAALAALAPATAIAEETDTTGLLRTLIETVIQDGDISTLDTLVSPDITAPDYTITGIDNFRAASIAGHAYRQSTYTDYRFDIIAITGNSEWAMAYVRRVGTTTAGQAEDTPVFYAARFADARIIQLFF